MPCTRSISFPSASHWCKEYLAPAAASETRLSYTVNIRTAKSLTTRVYKASHSKQIIQSNPRKGSKVSHAANVDAPRLLNHSDRRDDQREGGPKGAPGNLPHSTRPSPTPTHRVPCRPCVSADDCLQQPVRSATAHVQLRTPHMGLSATPDAMAACSHLRQAKTFTHSHPALPRNTRRQ